MAQGEQDETRDLRNQDKGQLEITGETDTRANSRARRIIQKK